MIDRPDWVKTEPEQSAEIQDGGEPKAERVDGRVVRPDWNGTEPQAKAERADGQILRPDWSGEPESEEPEDDWADDESPEPQSLEIEQPQILKALANSDEHDLGVASEAVTGILDNMPERAEFEAGFDELPTETQNTVLAELALTDFENPPYAPIEEINSFATTPEGKLLTEQWGVDSDIHLGRLQARLERMEVKADMSAAWSWFESLDSNQARVVLQVLAQ